MLGKKKNPKVKVIYYKILKVNFLQIAKNENRQVRVNFFKIFRITFLLIRKVKNWKVKVDYLKIKTDKAQVKMKVECQIILKLNFKIRISNQKVKASVKAICCKIWKANFLLQSKNDKVKMICYKSLLLKIKKDQKVKVTYCKISINNKSNKEIMKSQKIKSKTIKN